MTTFQLAMLGLFLVALVANYGKQLQAAIGKIKPAPSTPPVVAPAVPTTKPTTAYTVNDLTTIAELRDRLAAIGCNEGVEACKMLIRVMIEFKLP